jgi:hypothetical protein
MRYGDPIRRPLNKLKAADAAASGGAALPQNAERAPSAIDAVFSHHSG